MIASSSSTLEDNFETVTLVFVDGTSRSAASLCSMQEVPRDLHRRHVRDSSEEYMQRAFLLRPVASKSAMYFYKNLCGKYLQCGEILHSRQLLVPFLMGLEMDDDIFIWADEEMDG